MSPLFDWLGKITKPVMEGLDNLFTSDKERGDIEIAKSKLKNEIAAMEAKVATRLYDLQSEIVQANSKLAIAEQEHGNFLSKSWRPICSFCCMGLLIAMGLGFVQRDELLMQICGGFIGIYIPCRTWEKKKK